MAKEPTSKTVKLKPATPKVAPAKAAPAAVQTESNDIVKKPEFFQRVMARTEVKKRDAKPAIEAALAVLAEALVGGEDVSLPPMGKLKVVKVKDLGEGAKAVTLKLRTKKTTPAANKPDTGDLG